MKTLQNLAHLVLAYGHLESADRFCQMFNNYQ
jgi:hypothetical protein